MTMFKTGEAKIRGTFEICPGCGEFIKAGEQCAKCALKAEGKGSKEEEGKCTGLPQTLK